MKKIKVIVIDDSKFIRTLFTGLLNEHADIEVVDSAEDPYDAREKIKRHNPDVITLDIEMPKMDGISFLEKVMKLRPMPVVMASTLTKHGADITLRALEMGAVDYIAKPQDMDVYKDLNRLGVELATKIRSAASANVRAPSAEVMSRGHGNASATAARAPVRASSINVQADGSRIVAIGASTGGVEAIREVLIRLPKSMPPIVITQHMPEKFTEMFAQRLNNITEVTVSEAKDGEILKPGHAYIAPGGFQMQIAKSGNGYVARIFDGELVSGHKPSVDCLFDSVAKHAGNRAVGVILTGMGRDGADGMHKMKQSGTPTIGQSKDSCVVYGMPRAAAELGAVDLELPVEKIAEQILKHLAG